MNVVEVPLSSSEQLTAAELLKEDYPDLSTSERLAMLARTVRAMRQSWSAGKPMPAESSWPRFEHCNQMRFVVVVDGAEEPRDLEIELFGEHWYAKLQVTEHAYAFLMDDNSWGFEGIQRYFTNWRDAFDAAMATKEIEWLV